MGGQLTADWSVYNGQLQECTNHGLPKRPDTVEENKDRLAEPAMVVDDEGRVVYSRGGNKNDDTGD